MSYFKRLEVIKAHPSRWSTSVNFIQASIFSSYKICRNSLSSRITWMIAKSVNWILWTTAFTFMDFWSHGYSKSEKLADWSVVSNWLVLTSLFAGTSVVKLYGNDYVFTSQYQGEIDQNNKACGQGNLVKENNWDPEAKSTWLNDQRHGIRK